MIGFNKIKYGKFFCHIFFHSLSFFGVNLHMISKMTFLWFNIECRLVLEFTF